ncbi:putative peptidylprolyl isomerase [Helianthus anomalus]
MWCVDCWTVHYEGSLAETGEVFDTTHEDNTIFTFQLGKGPVIKAWDVAFRTMKVFFLPSSTSFKSSSHLCIQN